MWGSYPPGLDGFSPAGTQVEEGRADGEAAEGKHHFHHAHEDEGNPQDERGALVGEQTRCWHNSIPKSRPRENQRDTHVEAGRVKGALVGDAGGRVGGVGVLKVALLQQALSPVNDGFHHRNRQGHGGGERDDARQEAEDQQDPLLRGRDQREINLLILNICI